MINRKYVSLFIEADLTVVSRLVFFSPSVSVEKAVRTPGSVGIYLSRNGITLPAEHRGLFLVSTSKLQKIIFTVQPWV